MYSSSSSSYFIWQQNKNNMQPKQSQDHQSWLAIIINIKYGKSVLYKTQTQNKSNCAMQTNQQVQACQSLRSQTILEMLNQLSLYSLVIKYDFNSFLNIFNEEITS